MLTVLRLNPPHRRGSLKTPHSSTAHPPQGSEKKLQARSENNPKNPAPPRQRALPPPKKNSLPLRPRRSSAPRPRALQLPARSPHWLPRSLPQTGNSTPRLCPSSPTFQSSKRAPQGQKVWWTSRPQKVCENEVWISRSRPTHGYLGARPGYRPDHFNH